MARTLKFIMMNTYFSNENKHTMKQLSFFIGLTLLLMASCTSTSSSSKTRKAGIKFVEGQTYEAILEKAKVEGKPVMIDFYTTWCQPCKWLEKDVFEVKQVATFYNSNVINYKVNAENFDFIALAQTFEVAAYPTVVFVTQDGEVITRHEGTTTATNFINLGKKAVTINGNSLTLR